MDFEVGLFEEVFFVLFGLCEDFFVFVFVFGFVVVDYFLEFVFEFGELMVEVGVYFFGLGVLVFC